MRRFFVKNLLFVIAVNLLVKPVWIFLIDRTVQNRVGHTAYGTYQPLLNIGIIFQIILDFGLTNYNTNIISQEPGRLKSLFPAMFSAKLLLIAAYSLLVFAFALIAGYRHEELLMLAGIMSIQVLSSLVLFLRSNVAALHHFKMDGVLSVTDRLLMIFICGFLLYYPATASAFKIEWFILSQAFCYFIAVVAAFWVLYKIAHVGFSLTGNMKVVLPIIKKSLPYALLIFLMSIYTRSDMVLIERLGGINGKTQAGIYAAGYRLLDVGNMFGLMFAGMLLPLFGRMLSEKHDVQPIIKLCVNILLPLSFAVAMVAIFFGSDIMHLLYREATDYDGRVFAWLMASFPAFCMMYVYSTLLTANGSLALLNKIAVAGVIISVGLNLYMIPHYQALGAAITAFITQTILAIGFIIFAGQTLQLPKNAKWIGAHIGYIVFSIATIYLLSKLSLQWMICVVIYAIVSIIAIFVFRFVTVESLSSLLNKRRNA